jgi:hypothetical protein
MAHMALTLLFLLLAVFLTGFCAGILTVLVVSIHRGVQIPFLLATRGKRADATGQRAPTGTDGTDR